MALTSSLLLALLITLFLTFGPGACSASEPLSEALCGFKGDDNMYGLGIRLGVYFQWVTTSISNNFVPEEAAMMRGVNNCFQLSTFAGLMYITLGRGSSQNSGTLYAVEAFIVLLLCIGGVCSGRGLGNASEDKAISTTFADHRASRIGQIVRVLIAAASIYYGVWFVYIGMDDMAHPPCSQIAFFFAPVDLYHWYHILLKVIFTLSGIASGFLILESSISVFRLWSKDGAIPALEKILAFHEERTTLDTTISTSHSGQRKTVLTRTSFSFDLALFILTIELIIKWNHIQGVNTLGNTGQILPLIVGGSGLLRVLYKTLYKFIRKDYCFSPDYSFMSPLFLSYTRSSWKTFS
ncbi:hypothetical protein AOQ84DRAFT_443296 [Glonium stellatum]|uniref:Uncharacterized protein n=1 Tax=Glonium stellatum TaxID=574774 RepID=A0A8E2EPT0_9PEZI|nr:hypothetical protein AOQ84DRAFT_443296 [Glonium stellatum]